VARGRRRERGEGERRRGRGEYGRTISSTEATISIESVEAFTA
jgi:hypothetical protein